MTYNISFLVSALLFLLLILYHFMNRKRLEDSNSRVFRLVITLGILDILFDLLTTSLISGNHSRLSSLTLFLMTVFYLLQVLVPYILFLYSWSLGSTDTLTEKTVFYILSLPAAVMALMVIYNMRSEIFFSIDSCGNYVRGTCYLGMYLYALVYAGLTLICGIMRYRKLGFHNFCITCEFLAIMGGCVTVQAVRHDLLTTGLGLGLGITALYLTINNPSNYTDRLTGDFNLQSLLGWLQELYRKKKIFHVLVININHLEQINKLFGIRFGDEILQTVSETLNKILTTPYVFRTSSKRFVVLTYSLTEYERVRDRIHAFFSGNLTVEKEHFQFSGVICGILHAQRLKDCDMLLSYMDYLVSLAPAGTDTLLIQGDDNTLKGFQYNTEIEHYLRTAIDEDLFELYYQPVFSLEKGRFVTAEALSRLRHPVFGFISPEIFISIAERNGQIAQIGLLQFRRMCRFMQEHPHVMKQLDYINFNLSPAELLRDGYCQKLIDIIQEAGLPFSRFQFEITETVATEYSDKLYQIIADFTKRGIRLSLDDFGSGYANLNTVLMLPFTTIKLDRSLLNGITTDEKSACFYHNIVSILNNMGYHLIAEGVEQKSEAELLHSWGIHLIQGFYFSKPLTPEALTNLLDQSKAQ